MKAFANFMSEEIHCAVPEKINLLVEKIIEEIVEYEVPAAPEKKHLFMDIFLLFSDDFVTFGKD